MSGDAMGAEAPQKRTYTVREIADLLGVGTKAVYALVRSGQFSCVRVGSAIRVSKSSFDRWLDPESAIKEET